MLKIGQKVKENGEIIKLIFFGGAGLSICLGVIINMLKK